MLRTRCFLIILALALLGPTTAARDRSYLYMLPTMQTTEVALDEVSKELPILNKLPFLGSVKWEHVHYAGEVGFLYLKPLLVSGLLSLIHPGAGAAHAGSALTVAFEISTFPAGIMGKSFANLKLHSWWKRRKALADLKDVPGLEEIQTIMATHTRTQHGFFKQGSKSTLLVFVRTSNPLAPGAFGPELTAKYGDPVRVADAANTKLRVSLEIPDGEEPLVWTPSLAEVFRGDPLDATTLARWRKKVHDYQEKLTNGKSWKERIWDHMTENTGLDEVRLEATLIEPSGQERPIGTLGEGKFIKTFLEGKYHLPYTELRQGAGRLPAVRKRLRGVSAPEEAAENPADCIARLIALYARPKLNAVQ